MAYTVGDVIEPADIANRFWAYLSPEIGATNYSRTSLGGVSNPGNTSAPSRAFYGNDLGATGDIIDGSTIYDQCRIEANRFSALRNVNWRVTEIYRRDAVYGGNISTLRLNETRRRYGVVGTRGTAFFAESDNQRTDAGEVVDIGSHGTTNSLERMFDQIRDQYVRGRNATHTVNNSYTTCHTSCHSSHSSRGRR